MTQQILDELESDLARYQSDLDLGKALERLKANRDFKAVVMQGYLEAEAVRLVHLKATPNAKRPEIQEDIAKRLDAIGCFHQYLAQIQEAVEMANKTIEAIEQTRDSILQES